MPHSSTYAIALYLLKGCTPQRYKEWVEAAGTAEQFCLSPAAFGASQELSRLLVQQLPTLLQLAEQRQEQHSRAGVRIFIYEEPDYPLPLKALPAPPPLLYGKGLLPFAQPLSLCMVGTRQPTAYGKLMAEQLIEQLAGQRPLLISGRCLWHRCYRA